MKTEKCNKFKIQWKVKPQTDAAKILRPIKQELDIEIVRHKKYKNRTRKYRMCTNKCQQEFQKKRNKKIAEGKGMHNVTRQKFQKSEFRSGKEAGNVRGESWQ